MICFVMLSHREPGQIVRLVRRLADDDASAMLVHHDHLGDATRAFRIARRGSHRAGSVPARNTLGNVGSRRRNGCAASEPLD
jgi:hypothetical protein